MTGLQGISTIELLTNQIKPMANQKQQQNPMTVVQSLPVSTLDTKSIAENGESPTAIILAVAILLAVVFSSVTGLVQVILLQNHKRQSR